MLDPSVAQLDRDGDWQALTTLREKFLLLAADTAFRESWRAAVEVLDRRALEVVQRIVPVTVRPEAVLTGQTATCLQFLSRHDFALISSRRFRYTRRTIREVWRYQWNVASLDSMEISDLVHRKAPALLLFLLDRTPAPAVPAICRFTELKGTSAPSGRTPRHLRSVLGAPNCILVMVHAPDEPMDLVRELGVLFGPKTLTQLYRRLGKACAVSPPPAPAHEPVGASNGSSLWERTPSASPAPLSVEDAVAEFCEPWPRGLNRPTRGPERRRGGRWNRSLPHEPVPIWTGGAGGGTWPPPIRRSMPGHIS